MLGGRRGYRKFIQEGLGEGHREEYYEVLDQRFLGDVRILQRSSNLMLMKNRCQGRKNRWARRFATLPARLRLSRGCFQERTGGWETSRQRALAGYVLIRLFGYKLKDVAKCLGRDIATVSSLISRYSHRMAENENLKKQAARIAKHCLE